MALRAVLLAAAAAPVVASSPCAGNLAPLLDTMFSTLGTDCDTYVTLYAEKGEYFHQHGGYKNTIADIKAACTGYGTFCKTPGKSCSFLQDGAAWVVPRGDRCHVLAPYLWSTSPADTGNLEPHTGWEYIIAVPDASSKYGYRMELFAEIETSYSAALNWAKPDDTPALFEDSTLKLLRLPNSASKGECDTPVAPLLTSFFALHSTDGEVWRQQGDAVLLAAGGLCHIAVPYAANVQGTLETGRFVLTLQKDASSYKVLDSVRFPRGSNGPGLVVV